MENSIVHSLEGIVENKGTLQSSNDECYFNFRLKLSDKSLICSYYIKNSQIFDTFNSFNALDKIIIDYSKSRINSDLIKLRFPQNLGYRQDVEKYYAKVTKITEKKAIEGKILSIKIPYFKNEDGEDFKVELTYLDYNSSKIDKFEIQTQSLNLFINLFESLNKDKDFILVYQNLKPKKLDQLKIKFLQESSELFPTMPPAICTGRFFEYKSNI